MNGSASDALLERARARIKRWTPTEAFAPRYHTLRRHRANSWASPRASALDRADPTCGRGPMNWSAPGDEQSCGMAAPKLGGWDPFTPNEVAQVMRQAGVRWWVSGGWAIDLSIGHQTRPHDDIDIGVFRSDQEQIQRFFADWDVVIANNGRLRPWPAGKWLATPNNDLWIRDRRDGPWRIQIMLNDGGGDTWVSRRDLSIRVPCDDAIRVADGIPFLAPHLQLLFKASAPRPKDEADFVATIGCLTPRERIWLENHIRDLNARHLWLSQLRGASRLHR